jgi:hypothetical protein
MEDRVEILPIQAEKESSISLLKTTIAASVTHYINNRATVDLNLRYLNGKIGEKEMESRIKEILSFTKPLAKIANKNYSQQQENFPVKNFSFNPESVNQASREILVQLNIPLEKNKKSFEVFYRQLEELTKGLPNTLQALARLKKVFLGKEQPQEIDRFGVVVFKEKNDQN